MVCWNISRRCLEDARADRQQKTLPLLLYRRLLVWQVFLKYDVHCYYRWHKIKQSCCLRVLFCCLFCCLDTMPFFFSWLVSSILSVVSHALAAALAWHCCACTWVITMPAHCCLVCFFPGKARGNLPTISVVFLAESKKTSGRWVYLGRMVRRNDEPSSFCSVLSVQLHHLPLLNCKWEFGITYSLFLVH